MVHRIIISISSDIGYHLAKDWLKNGVNVSGTYRNKTPECEELEELGAKLISSDLNSEKSIDESIKQLSNFGKWDSLVVATGIQDPIGKFLDIDINAWSDSIKVNFTSQMRYIHGLLPNRNLGLENPPSVLMFAGGGTNNATVDYSAYTISKIASIKAIELLDAEITDTSFIILGPGWVKTKIHQSTLIAKNKAGKNYSTTIKKFKNNDFYPISKVISCCNWIFSAKHELVAGRNFSSVFDPWEKKEIINKILCDDNNFKLRRFGNEIFTK